MGDNTKPLTPEVRFWKFVSMIPFHDCWEWTGTKDRHGYGLISSVGPNKKKMTVLAHRISFKIHVGEIQKGKVICHVCDNRGCVNPRHMFIGTVKDNNMDKAIKERASRKLTKEDVLKIRELCKTDSVAIIADMFNVTKTSIRDIKKLKTWSWV